MNIENIRNFAIIAHIDHGKSTLADRFLELTKTIPENKLQPQYLDKLSLERERGITIKMAPVKLFYKEYILNLIDTPGHIDFSYEVSRALAAVEGVILLIDGTQGIQAQTLAHLEIAKQLGLKIIPAINKIDLQISSIDSLIDDISRIVEVETEEDIYLVSGKTGEGVEKLLEAVVKKIPSPKLISESLSSALIFDSNFDAYKGTIAHIRVFSGEFKAFENLFLKSNNFQFKPVEVGIFSPDFKKIDKLGIGEIGYIATGIRDAGVVKIGDTITDDLSVPLLPGYKEAQPVIFASIFPAFVEASAGKPGSSGDFDSFKESIERLRLQDPSVKIEPAYSSVFGRGYLIGCMGLLHLDIFQERLKREFSTEIIITLPSLRYELLLKDNTIAYIQNAQELSLKDKLLEIREPWTKTEIFTPLLYIEIIFNLIKASRGIIKNQIVRGSFAIIECEIPLDELITGLFDDLKSVSSGYASLTWEFLEYRKGDLVRLDILIAEETNPALSRIITKGKAESISRKILKELKELLPRELFVVKLQASMEGRIIARETIPALKADVAGYLYGGDRTRKMKLWQKQKRGKKKLLKRGVGRVRVPNDVLIKILKVK